MLNLHPAAKQQSPAWFQAAQVAAITQRRPQAPTLCQACQALTFRPELQAHPNPRIQPRRQQAASPRIQLYLHSTASPRAMLPALPAVNPRAMQPALSAVTRRAALVVLVAQVVAAQSLRQFRLQPSPLPLALPSTRLRLYHPRIQP